MEAASTTNSTKEVIAIEPEEESNSQLKPENRSFRIPMMDRTILPRVKHYLKEHRAVYVDIDEMVDDLRRAYHEYGRRKRVPFKLAVEQAFERIVQMHKGMEEPASHSTSEEEEDDDDDDDDDDDPDDPEELNPTNDQLMVMYAGQNLRKRPQHRGTEDDDDGGGAGEKELINISSDESGKEESSMQNVANGTLSKNAPPVTETQTSKPTQVTKSTTPQAQQTLPPTRTYAKRKRPTNTEASVTQQTKRRKEVSTVVAKTTFEDFGGNTKALEEICQLLIHIRHPEVYKQIGVSPPRGFLLHGPPGCGKTLLAQAISGELQVPMISVAAPELVAGVSGESEERIRNLFNQAVATAPCILFLDEIDAITPNRHTAQREMERRIVAQLLSCLDELALKENGDRIVIIGATNRPDALDPALRRAGRFDREVCLGIPDEKARIDILKVLCKKLKLTEDFDFHYIAKNTPGFVGADLTALTREAAVTAVNRVFTELQNKMEEKMEMDESEIIVEDLPNVKPTGENTTSKDSLQDKKTSVENSKGKTLSRLMTWFLTESPVADEELRKLTVTLDDFKTALKCVQPSAKREGFATIPDVTWEDIGSLKEIREELQMTILAPVRYPEQFQELGISTPSGVLLCGPPGCGKTLLAKAVANEAGINFISVKGPELLNMYVGESEKAVRQCFQRARNSVPCVIFFDEIDALCPKRSDSGEGGASMRVVNQMLTEMDGIESRKGVFLMAASNRPDIIDPAVLRPGRLDKLLYIGLPSAADRIDILKAITKNGKRPCLDSDVDLEAIATNNSCERYTGADLAALVREAGIEALKEYMNLAAQSKKLVITNEHFLNAFKKIRPSVSEKDQKHYEKLQTMYSSISKEGSS